MSFLSDNWDKIQPPQKEMGVLKDAVAEGHMYPWNSDIANIYMITSTLKILKPKIIVETGTFEALATIAIATVASDGGNCILWTFDAEGPVSVYGDGKTVQENWETDPMFVSFKKVKQRRLERISNFNNTSRGCEIRFVVGLTQETLPLWKNTIGLWDFWFQDSVHGFPLIQGELAELEPTSHPGSIIVFDDITAEHPLREWFRLTHPDWETRWTDKGRCQLWAERIR